MVMTKRVLVVGNCVPDHAAVRRLIEVRFDAQVFQTHGTDDSLSELRSKTFDLVLVNRIFDRDGGDGLALIQQIKQDAALSGTPCMLITNFPEHQEFASQTGAEPGFGKAELNQPETVEKLRPFLG